MQARPSTRRLAALFAGLLTASALTCKAPAATFDGPPLDTKAGATQGSGSGIGSGASAKTGTGAAPSAAVGTAGGSDTGTPDRRGERSRGDRLVPGLIVGALAIAAIGSLLNRERQPAGQPGPALPPPDQVADRLRSEGPHLANEFNMSAFVVRGFVRGGWPMLIDFQQRSGGISQLRISARDLTEVYTYELSEACPPPRRCLIQFQLPMDIFGDQLRPAVIAVTATDAAGRDTLQGFTVHALGAGPRAVGSVAIDRVSFGPPSIRVTEQQSALYKFYSRSDFSNTSVEFWKVEPQRDGSKHFFVDDRAIDGGVQKNQWIGRTERKEWNGLVKGEKVSAGRHKVQVRAWDRVGDWVTAWSDTMVKVDR